MLVGLAAAPAAGAAPRAHSAAAEVAEESLQEAQELIDGEGVRSGRELSHALLELSVGLRHLRGSDRGRAVSLLSRPTESDAPADERYAVPELPPLCSAEFCVHSVGSGADAAPAGMAAFVLAEARAVRSFENGTLGWALPPSDGDNRVDIYLKELGPDGLFGFAATDPGQRKTSQHSYLVIDNDFDPAEYGGIPALDSLRVTLAHEYGHVLQYGYDVTADGWHYEASAVWLEQRMRPELPDWLRFVDDRGSGAGWRSLTELPLTAFDDPGDQPRNSKPYGNVVWNQFLSGRYGAAGDRLQRATWELSNGLEEPSTSAHDRAIKQVGGNGIADEYAAFAAAVAEWHAPGSLFPSTSALPDVERRGSLATDGAPVSISMDHLTFALYDVPATEAGRIRLAADFPARTAGAIALVARAGTHDGGQVSTRLVELAEGGAGGVTLDRPASFFATGGRVTAVLVNADASQRGYDEDSRDWQWAHDRQPVTARITSDTSGPSVTSSRPATGATRVSTRPRIRATFSEPVAGVDARSFVLRGPGGATVPASVAYDAASRTATLTPSAPLADTTRYTVALTDAISDIGATPLSVTRWSFTTVARAPRAKLTVTSGDGLAAAFKLRSRDRDRLRFTATLVRGGRTLARRSGTLRAGELASLRLAGGHRGRARLVVQLEDPQGNALRITRRLRLRP
jgi:hypothetical protein